MHEAFNLTDRDTEQEHLLDYSHNKRLESIDPDSSIVQNTRAGESTIKPLQSFSSFK